MNISVVGGGIRTCHGDLNATWSALMTGARPGKHELPEMGCAYPLAEIAELEGAFGSSARLQALLQGLYDTLPRIPRDTELILATTKGAIDELFVSDHPASGQVYQLATDMRERLGLERKGSCVSAACVSGTVAIIQGAMRIAAGVCDHALIVGIDLLSRFVIGGFASLKALSPSQCRPFDQHRDGLTLGEGCGWLLLSRERGAFGGTGRYFTLTGWGISCDATHITAPCRKASGLLRSLRQALSLSPVRPGGINAHGTGTSYNDAMELLAFRSLWPEPPPVCSIKGAIGHCLGAAGVIEGLISLKSLEQGHLPPTVGLMVPADEATFVSGTEALPLVDASILSCNSGFGGINAAVFFSEDRDY